ncbi:MAG: DNA/RNA nuclease SfsA [Pseudomonadota bacterium]
MRFQTELVRATLVRRYKRFFADCRLEDGRQVTAHCANTGPMTGLVTPGERVWLEPNDDPKRKLKYGWRLLQHADGHFTGVDTSVPNRLLKEALAARQVAALAAYETVRTEVKYGENSRIDFLLSQDGLPDCYVEVKSVTLCRTPGLAEFPDTVTTRGAKHMGELARVAQAGHRAVVLYLVQRTDCDSFDVARDLDPGYAAAHQAATAAGVETLCLSAHISPEEITLGPPLALALRNG